MAGGNVIDSLLERLHLLHVDMAHADPVARKLWAVPMRRDRSPLWTNNPLLAPIAPVSPPTNSKPLPPEFTLQDKLQNLLSILTSDGRRPLGPPLQTLMISLPYVNSFSLREDLSHCQEDARSVCRTLDEGQLHVVMILPEAKEMSRTVWLAALDSYFPKRSAARLLTVDCSIGMSLFIERNCH